MIFLYFRFSYVERWPNGITKDFPAFVRNWNFFLQLQEGCFCTAAVSFARKFLFIARFLPFKASNFKTRIMTENFGWRCLVNCEIQGETVIKRDKLPCTGLCFQLNFGKWGTWQCPRIRKTDITWNYSWKEGSMQHF